MGLIFHSVKPLSLDHSDFQASCFQRGQVSVLRPRRSPCLYGGSGSAPALGMLALKHSWVQRTQMVVIEIYLLHPSAVNLDPKGQMDTDGHCVLTTAALLFKLSELLSEFCLALLVSSTPPVLQKFGLFWILLGLGLRISWVQVWIPATRFWSTSAVRAMLLRAAWSQPS